MTILILFVLARCAFPLRALGAVGYLMIILGGLITALSPYLLSYALGFLLIVGFDKVFNVYMRTVRQRIIPAQDFGKTVGVMTLLNNCSQPFAGLMVSLLATPLGTQSVILIVAMLATVIGGLAMRYFAGTLHSSPRPSREKRRKTHNQNKWR